MIRIVVMFVVVVVLVAGGWFASMLFVSPEQREAAASAPVAQPILAPVERGALADQITVAVESGRANRRSLTLPVGEGALSVVTARPVVHGDEVKAGDVIAEVNGRPILVLPGSFPFYRDLQEGDEGADVRQLQKALAAAGHDVRETGVLQKAAVDAVADLYTDAGYAAPDGGALRRSEMLVSSLPATVLSVPPVGTEADGSAFVEIEAGDRIGRADVPPAIAAKLAVGLTGTVYGTDQPAEVVAVELAEDPSADAVLLVTVDFGESEDTLTVQFETDRVTDDALLVPSTAVAHAGERATVIRSRGDARTVVAVRIIGTLNGRSAIEPVDNDALVEGDQVTIE